ENRELYGSALSGRCSDCGRVCIMCVNRNKSHIERTNRPIRMRVLVLRVSCMAPSIPYGARSTADQVLAGIDLTRKRIVVTGCSSGIGFETMNALVANGAHVIGLARTRDAAQAACHAAGPSATPIACD